MRSCFSVSAIYEMFFNDAIVASKELEIVLTSRDAGAPSGCRCAASLTTALAAISTG